MKRAVFLFSCYKPGNNQQVLPLTFSRKDRLQAPDSMDQQLVGVAECLFFLIFENEMNPGICL